MRVVLTRILLCGLCLVMSACALYTKPQVPPQDIPEKFKYEVNVAPTSLKYDWWENFNDAELNHLVNVAIKNNYNYLISLKNIDIANTYVTQNQSLLFPQVNLNFDLSRNKAMNVFGVQTGGTTLSGRTYNLVQLFGTVSYEVDLWNQIGNTVNQSKAEVVASFADSNIVRLSLIAGVTNTYFQIKALNANIANLKKQEQIAKKLLHVNTAQYHGTLIDVTNVATTKNVLEGVAINIKNLEKQKEILTNSLAYMLGIYPEDLVLRNTAGLSRIRYATLIPAGVPAQIMSNRPDVQMAFAQAMSAGYVEKQTIANFLPSINLTGNYGYANTNFQGLFSGRNSVWSIGENLLQPIFDYKLRLSEYRRAKYQFQSALLNFKNTVVSAFQEIDNALISYQKDDEMLHAYQNQINNSRHIVKVSDAQYRAGYGDYATYLSNELSLLQNEYNLINQQVLVIQDVVQIYKTFGLGLLGDEGLTPNQS